jgi:hypothetical protein
MTPKQALKWLFLKASKQHRQLWEIKLTKPYDERKRLVDEITSDLDDHYGELNDTFYTIDQALTKLEELKRYPTADEVCKALGEYLERTVKMDIDNTFYYSDKNKLGEYDEIICGYGWEHKHHTVGFDMDLPPHLITLIGRFYEGLEKVGKE